MKNFPQTFLHSLYHQSTSQQLCLFTKSSTANVGHLPIPGPASFTATGSTSHIACLRMRTGRNAILLGKHEGRPLWGDRASALPPPISSALGSPSLSHPFSDRNWVAFRFIHSLHCFHLINTTTTRPWLATWTKDASFLAGL